MIPATDLAAIAEMRTAMADALRANARAAAHATLRTQGLTSGPGADDDRREHARIAAHLRQLAAGQPRTGRR